MSLTDSPAKPDAAWQIKTLVQSAAALLKSGDEAGAEDIYRRILEAAPFNGAALSYFARKSYLGGNLQEALALMEKAIEGAPRNLRHYENRAQIYTDMGRMEDAIRDLDTLADLAPHYAIPHFRKALLLRDIGQRETAVRILIATWQRFPNIELDANADGISDNTRTVITEAAGLVRATQLVMVDSELELVIERYGKESLQRLFDALAAFTGLTPGDPASMHLRPGLTLPGLAEQPDEAPDWYGTLYGRLDELRETARRLLPDDKSDTFTRIVLDTDAGEDHKRLAMLLEGVPLVARPDGGISVIRASLGIHPLSPASAHNWRQEAYIALELPAKTALSFGTRNTPVEAGKVLIGPAAQPHHLQVGSGGSAIMLSFSVWHQALNEAEREGLPAALRGIRRFNAKYNPPAPASAA